MPYLTIDTDQIRSAWKDANTSAIDEPSQTQAAGEQLNYGRQAVTVHVLQGGTLANAADLIETVQVGELA